MSTMSRPTPSAMSTESMNLLHNLFQTKVKLVHMVSQISSKFESFQKFIKIASDPNSIFYFADFS